MFTLNILNVNYDNNDIFDQKETLTFNNDDDDDDQ